MKKLDKEILEAILLAYYFPTSCDEEQHKSQLKAVHLMISDDVDIVENLTRVVEAYDKVKEIQKTEKVRRDLRWQILLKIAKTGGYETDSRQTRNICNSLEEEGLISYEGQSYYNIWYGSTEKGLKLVEIASTLEKENPDDKTKTTV